MRQGVSALSAWVALGACAAICAGTASSGSTETGINEAIELTLSVSQQSALDFFARCHRDNTQSPYLFELSSAQSEQVHGVSGRTPQRLVVFDARRREPVDIRLNHALRISSDRLRVPLQNLVDGPELNRYEREVMGWETNPLLARWKEQAGDVESAIQRPPCE